MVGNEAGNFNFKIEMPGQERETSSGRIAPMTQDTIARWIRVQDYLDEETQNDLITLALTYPDSALKSFVDNFNIMIMRVREKRAKESR